MAGVSPAFVAGKSRAVPEQSVKTVGFGDSGGKNPAGSGRKERPDAVFHIGEWITCPNICAKDPHDLTHLPDSLRAFCMGKPRHIPKKPKEKEYAFDNVLKKNRKEKYEVMQVL